MINDLLDLTRIEQGRVQLDSSRPSPADLLARRLSADESSAVDAGITLSGSAALGSLALWWTASGSPTSSTT